MTLPHQLLEHIKSGRAVLLLGSGALVGATLAAGPVPMGMDLRDMLSERFLGGEHATDSLQLVSALSISQSSLIEVQDYIRDYLADLTPAEFHKTIPEFKWRAIFTTNYDRLVEICYERSKADFSSYELILQNSDSLDITRTSDRVVPIIKLHGCITRTHDQNLPLILTTEQYNQSHLERRSNLFNHLYELAYSNTIIFVGHGMQDANVQAVMDRVLRESPDGLRHYLVRPGVGQIEIDYWSQKKISVLDLTFSEFLGEVKSCISENVRALSRVRPRSELSISNKLVTREPLSEGLRSFLENDVDHVYSSMPRDSATAAEFYKGESLSWHGVQEELAVRRSIELSVLDKVFYLPEGDRKEQTELFVVKGEAGSGKTIFLRQCAWVAQRADYGIVLWVKSRVRIKQEIIQELESAVKERIFLIWDDAASNAQEIERTYKSARSKNIKLTILTSERYSEWNARCDGLASMLADEYPLRNLNRQEVENLVDLLDMHDCLGPNLVWRDREGRIDQFMIEASRQLLVALYEATSGKSFEDIIVDEYEKITPSAARNVYLTISTLNRLRASVRAGLISRVHNINFERFQSEFLSPLEMIVKVEHRVNEDAHYVTRHPEIANIVFNRILVDPSDRLNEYISIISKMNISFESDRAAFRRLVRARDLLELFSSHEAIDAIYEKAVDTAGRDSYLLQQMANYERLRPNGNFKVAHELLREAKEGSPRDGSIVHSLATLWKDQAKAEENSEARRRCRGEARSLLIELKSSPNANAYTHSSLVELALDDLEELAKDEKSSERSIDEQIRRAERQLIETKQKFPSDQQIHIVESRFATILRDDQRALAALKESFKHNSRDPFIASRLAKTLRAQGEHADAVELLQAAVDKNRGEQRLQFQLAEMLRDDPSVEPGRLEYHYSKSYSPRDSNVAAQFWHARYLFESTEPKKIAESRDIFDSLRSAPTKFSERRKIRSRIVDLAGPQEFTGSVSSVRHDYGFITRDGRGDDIFFSISEIAISKAVEDDLILLKVSDRVSFNIGFTMEGPTCTNVRCV